MGCGGRAFGQQRQRSRGLRLVVPTLRRWPGDNAPCLIARNSTPLRRYRELRHLGAGGEHNRASARNNRWLRLAEPFESSGTSVAGDEERCRYWPEPRTASHGEGAPRRPGTNGEGTPRRPGTEGWGNGRATLPSGRRARLEPAEAPPQRAWKAVRRVSPSPRGGREAARTGQTAPLGARDTRSYRGKRRHRSPDLWTKPPSGGRIHGERRHWSPDPRTKPPSGGRIHGERPHGRPDPQQSERHRPSGRRQPGKAPRQEAESRGAPPRRRDETFRDGVFGRQPTRSALGQSTPSGVNQPGRRQRSHPRVTSEPPAKVGPSGPAGVSDALGTRAPRGPGPNQASKRVPKQPALGRGVEVPASHGWPPRGLRTTKGPSTVGPRAVLGPQRDLPSTTPRSDGGNGIEPGWDQAQGSIGRLDGGNAGKLQRTSRKSKALRSSERRKEAGPNVATRADPRPETGNNDARESACGDARRPTGKGKAPKGVAPPGKASPAPSPRAKSNGKPETWRTPWPDAGCNKPAGCRAE